MFLAVKILLAIAAVGFSALGSLELFNPATHPAMDAGFIFAGFVSAWILILVNKGRRTVSLLFSWLIIGAVGYHIYHKAGDFEAYKSTALYSKLFGDYYAYRGDYTLAEEYYIRYSGEYVRTHAPDYEKGDQAFYYGVMMFLVSREYARAFYSADLEDATETEYHQALYTKRKEYLQKAWNVLQSARHPERDTILNQVGQDYASMQTMSASTQTGH